VSVLFTVSTTGRVTDCQIRRSSGDPRLDDATCDLIIRRFRFDPSRDAQGRPVESLVESDHTWVFD
jgi:protein TonB